MAETELERAEKRYAQARARLQALKNREATRQRKLDTRRKVILGGALMDLAERDSSAAAMVERLIRTLPRERDRKVFAGEKGRSSVPDGTDGGKVPAKALGEPESTPRTRSLPGTPDGPERAPEGL